MANGWFLRIIIFVGLWVLGAFFFSGFGGAAGTSTSILYIGSSIAGSNLNSDGNTIITMIITFIITAAVYFFISMILTYIIMKIFRRK